MYRNKILLLFGNKLQKVENKNRYCFGIMKKFNVNSTYATCNLVRNQSYIHTLVQIFCYIAIWNKSKSTNLFCLRNLFLSNFIRPHELTPTYSVRMNPQIFGNTQVRMQ